MSEEKKRHIDMSATPSIEFLLLNSDAKAPTRATINDAGLDIYAYADFEVKPGVNKIPTGFAVQMPLGTYGRIAIRSGLAAKYMWIVNAGVIDAGYRDEVCVILMSLEPNTIVIKKGDRFAQLVPEMILTCESVCVNEFSRSATARSGGFGSTGK